MTEVMQPPVTPDQGQPSFEQAEPSPHDTVFYESSNPFARKVSEFNDDQNAGQFLPHELLAYDGSIITTSAGNRYFLKAHKRGSSYQERINQLNAPEGTVSEWVLDGSDDASVKIGEKWDFDMGGAADDVVAKVDIDDGLINLDPKFLTQAKLNELEKSAHKLRVSNDKDPFLEAERQAQAIAADVEAPAEPTKTAEAVKARPEQIVYPANGNKEAFIVSEYAQDGMEVAFANLPEARRVERRILITTKSGKELYIYDDKIFNPKDRSPEGQLRSRALGDKRMLPTLKIGEKYEIAGISTDEVAKVEIFIAKVSQDNKSEYEKFGKNPNAGDRINRFAELEKLLSDTGYAAEYPQQTSRGLFQKPEKPEKTPRNKRNLKLLGSNALLAAGYSAQTPANYGKNVAKRSVNQARKVIEEKRNDRATAKELLRQHKQQANQQNLTPEQRVALVEEPKPGPKKRKSDKRGRKIAPAEPVEPRQIV